MNDFVIVTDSSCDLPQKLADQMGLKLAYLSVLADGKNYTNYLDWRDIPAGEFYQILRDEKPASTSAPNIDDFTAVMEPVLQEGRDLLYLGFSSALSSTYNTGALAAAELQDRYPDRKVRAVDTLCASLGQGLFVTLVDEHRREGHDIDDCVAFAEQLRDHLCHWFTVDDLHFLHRGGRVSKTTAVLGSALQIKPIMHCDAEGRLTKMGTARGRKASLVALRDELVKTIIEPEKQVIYISHGDCLQDAETLAALVREKVQVRDIIINHVGPVIGSHSGPGTMALFHVGTKR